MSNLSHTINEAECLSLNDHHAFNSNILKKTFPLSTKTHFNHRPIFLNPSD